MSCCLLLVEVTSAQICHNVVDVPFQCQKFGHVQQHLVLGSHALRGRYNLASYFALLLCTVLHLLIQQSTEGVVKLPAFAMCPKMPHVESTYFQTTVQLKQFAPANDRYLATPSSKPIQHVLESLGMRNVRLGVLFLLDTPAYKNYYFSHVVPSQR